MSETELASVVAPDAIDPVEGWKAWKLGADGRLYSQQGNFPWTPGERFGALCLHGPRTYLVWEADRRPNGEETEPVRYDQKGGPTGPTGPVAMSAVAYTVPTFERVELSEPEIELPYPLRWYYRQKQVVHESPFEDCSCGIYMTADRDEAARYGDVLGICHGWGKVIEHRDGHRAQYAYPKELYVTHEQAKRIADYGVPLVLLDEPLPRPTQEPSFARRMDIAYIQVFLAFAIVADLVFTLVGDWPIFNAGAAVICALALGYSRGRH